MSITIAFIITPSLWVWYYYYHSNYWLWAWLSHSLWLHSTTKITGM